MPPLTDGQEKLLSLLPIIPSLLSLAGSSTIVYVVYKHYQKTHGQTTVYHRLLVGMSCCDLITSFWYPWKAFLLPASSEARYPRVWAIGNDVTCHFLGWIFNFGFSGLLYNTTLSYYFVLTARFGWKERDIARKVEPWLHAVAVLYPTACAFAFVGMDVYGEQPIGLGCWVSDYPHDCQTNPRVECITPMLAWISAGIPVLVAFVSLVVNNLLIYCHVRSTVKRAQQYAARYNNNNSSSHSTNDDSHGGLFGSSHLSFQSAFSSLRRKSASAPSDAQTRRIQAVAVQAGLYVLVFFLNYLWTMMLRNIGADEKYWNDEHESDLYWLLVLEAIFVPMQGAFNLAVFCRPKYLRTRKSFPHQSRIWVFRRAMFGEEAVPLPKPPPALVPTKNSDTTATKTDNSNNKGRRRPALMVPRRRKTPSSMMTHDESITAHTTASEALTVSAIVPASAPQHVEEEETAKPLEDTGSDEEKAVVTAEQQDGANLKDVNLKEDSNGKEDPNQADANQACASSDADCKPTTTTADDEAECTNGNMEATTIVPPKEEQRKSGRGRMLSRKLTTSLRMSALLRSATSRRGSSLILSDPYEQHNRTMRRTYDDDDVLDTIDSFLFGVEDFSEFDENNLQQQQSQDDDDDGDKVEEAQRGGGMMDAEPSCWDAR